MKSRTKVESRKLNTLESDIFWIAASGGPRPYKALNDLAQIFEDAGESRNAACATAAALLSSSQAGINALDGPFSRGTGSLKDLQEARGPSGILGGF